MPPSQKQIVTHTFTGAMQRDVAKWLISSDSYYEALNIRIYQSGDVGLVVNCKGNTEILFDLPQGENYCIGSYGDTENNKFYFFNWNEDGYHGVYMYDYLLNKVTPVLINLTDTSDIDILQFQKRSLILMIDVIRNPKLQDMIYWVDGQVKPKKFNIQKALDKTITGYGMVISAQDINAYKLAAIFAPSLSYFTDTTREANYLYTYLFKASVRHIYDDGERNNWSEFSTVPLPVNTDPTVNVQTSNVNNGLKIVVETGASIVTHIEIAVQITTEPFVSIIVLDKEKLGISDDTTYEYLFYNDNSSYSGLDQLNVYRAYSFLPRLAAVQAFTRKAMVYGKGIEGFPVVDIDISVAVTYDTLFLPSGTVNELNQPDFGNELADYDFTREGHGRRRNSLITLTIGHDVKAGNKFELWGRNGESDSLYFFYTATNADDAVSVANAFKQQLVATTRIRDRSEDLPDTNIWDNDINGSGDVSFSFIWYGRFNENYTVFDSTVNAVSFASLKNEGQSLSTHKSGDSIKYGIIYWDEDTRRSLTYTSDAGFVRNDFVTQTSGYKKIVHTLSIMHQPPVWAKYWELVRTQSLTYGSDFVHILIQKAIESQSTTDTSYIDLVIGSLYTYQGMYPNTVVTYEFEKNDRVRLIRKEDTGVYYTFLETIVLDFKPVGTSETINENVTINNTATVTIGGVTNADNIGRYIVIDGIEREIIAAPTGGTYTIDRAYNTDDGTGSFTYAEFKIVDKRGILRVRQPVGVVIADNSLIEVYKPTQNVESAEKNFYLFGQKYAITDWGTDFRAHTGNIQNQDWADPVVVPAIVEITKGTTYIRNRQLPTNNQIPGTQVVVDLVEDHGYSDFYPSTVNDNGKIAPEDQGGGEIRYGSRLRFSNNYIEGTGVNGLNDFDNLNREDYNDPYGDFQLLKFREAFLFAFKQLKTGYIPILATIINDDQNQQVLGVSTKLLNKLQYFAWEGGIGNNPESYAADQTWQYFLSPNSGTDCRIGGDGVLPISHQFGLDQTVREYIDKSVKYSSFIFGGFDRQNNERILAFEPHNEYLYNNDFDEAYFQLFHADYPEGTEYEITQQPQHGTVTINGDGDFVYTPSSSGGSDGGGYTGPDYFYYRWRVPAGEWTEPKRSCGYVTPNDVPAPATVYYSALYTEDFDRANCDSGEHGSSVTYTVPALKYTSSYNQADADQQAANDAAINGQAYADDPANGGTCSINPPPAFSFTDQTDLNINTLTESDAITLPSDYPDYIISITTGEYELNDSGTWTSAEGIVEAGDTVKIRRTTSDDYSTAATATLTIGGVSDTWSITTKVAPDVTIAWTNAQCLDPNVLGYFRYSLNGVQQFETFINASGNVTVPAGSSVTFQQFSNADFMPWPDNGTGTNSARLLVSNGATALYDNTVTIQTDDLHGANYTWTVLEDGVYSVIASTASTMTGFLKEVLEVDTSTFYAGISLEDDSTELSVFHLSPLNEVHQFYPFNVLDNADTITGVFENLGGVDMDVLVEGEGAFSDTITVTPGNTGLVTGIPKGFIHVTITGGGPPP